MSESEQGYTEINLDVGTKEVDSNFEIVDETAEETSAPASTAPSPAPAPAATETEDDDGDDGDGEGTPRKRLTRTQRLKAQRDAFAQKLREAEERAKQYETRLKKYETDAEEGASVALDIYIKSIDDGLKAARADFDRAFADGNQDALWQAQLRVAELIAEKKNAENERRKFPLKGARSGGEAQPPTPTTTQPPPSQQPRPTGGKGPSPFALVWHKQNPWFGKDPIMTVTAQVIDSIMVQEGFDPNDPDYFDELDRRLRNELPHKFQADTPKNKSPVMQQKTTPAASGGKIRVTLTAEDKRLANSLGIPLERYARQKYLREQAEQKNDYVEIL